MRFVLSLSLCPSLLLGTSYTHRGNWRSRYTAVRGIDYAILWSMSLRAGSYPRMLYHSRLQLLHHYREQKDIFILYIYTWFSLLPCPDDVYSVKVSDWQNGFSWRKVFVSLPWQCLRAQGRKIRLYLLANSRNTYTRRRFIDAVCCRRHCWRARIRLEAVSFKLFSIFLVHCSSSIFDEWWCSTLSTKTAGRINSANLLRVLHYIFYTSPSRSSISCTLFNTRSSLLQLAL